MHGPQQSNKFFCNTYTWIKYKFNEKKQDIYQQDFVFLSEGFVNVYPFRLVKHNWRHTEIYVKSSTMFVISSQAFAKNTAVSRSNENILGKKCFSGNSWQARNFCERILSWLSPSGKVQTLTHRGRPSQVETSFKMTAAWSWWWVCGRAWCQHKMPAPWLRSVETVETRVDEAWHLCVFSRSQLPRESIPLDCHQRYK